MTAVPPTMRAEYAARRPGLWGLPALFALVGAHAVAVAVVVSAWYTASQQDTPQDQIVWGNVAASGLLLALAGQAGWLLAGRRAVGHRTRALSRAAPAVVDPPRDGGSMDSPVTSISAPAPALLVVRNGSRFHVPACALLADRPVDEVTRADASRRGLQPCGMCDARTAAP